MTAPLYTFRARAADGGELNLGDYRGQVLLIVNTASRCGFTPQYQGLEDLYRKFRPRGFTVIGFPCNQFGGQEPGENAEILEFCRSRFDVDFPMAEKIEVNGKDAHPLYRYLTETAPGFLGTEAIKWNFTKFLVDRQGTVVHRYPPTTAPEDIADDIEELLQKEPEKQAE